MSTAYTVNEDDLKWTRVLDQKGNAGRKLDEHLKRVDFVILNANRTESPLQEVTAFRRVFCHAFAESARCFGLPSDTPKCIAIVNLSGYRAIMYSSNTALVRFLCMLVPGTNESTNANVEAVITHAQKHNTSLLCCFSLPWQSGIHQIHWEIRTLERGQNGSVRDGACCFSSTHEEVRVAPSSTECGLVDPLTLKGEIDAMKESFAAANLDAQIEDVSSSSGDGGHSKKLSSIVAAVQADRSRLLDEMACLRTEQVQKIADLKREADTRVAQVVQQATTASHVASKKIEEMDKHIKTLREQNAALEKKNAELIRQKASQDLQFAGKETALKNKAQLASASAKVASDNLSALQKSSTRERENTEKAHKREVESVERRRSLLELDVRRLTRTNEDASEVQARMDSVIESMRLEKQALDYERLATRKRLVCFQAALVLATKRHMDLQTSKKHSDASKQSSDAARAELAQMLVAAEKAAKEAAKEAEKAREATEAALKENREAARVAVQSTLPVPEQAAPHPPATPTAPPPTMVDTAINTEPQQDPTELSELRAEVGALNAEKESWLRTETELKEKLQTTRLVQQTDPPVIDTSSAASSPTMGDTHVRQEVYNNVYNHVVVPPAAAGNSAGNSAGNGGANGWHPPVDLGVDPSGDVGVEAVVAQLQIGMRTLVDMARQGHGHKHAADNMWSELQAIKRMTSDNGVGWCQPTGYFPVGEMIPVQNWMPQQMHGVHGAGRGGGGGVGRRPR